VNEKQLQAAVVDAALALGWRAYHTFDSRRSAAGFPDLVLVRPRLKKHSPPRLLFAELKTQRGRLTPDQAHWRDALTQVELEIDFQVGKRGPLSVHVWRPEQWNDGTVEKALR